MTRTRYPADNEDPSLQPRDPRTGEPLAPRTQPGYYAGFSTLSQSPFWEEATRTLVMKRVNEPVPRRFFSKAQWRFWEVVFEHLLPQTDRIPERRILLLPPLDTRLLENRTGGYRFETMPPDRDVYTDIGIRAINSVAQEHFGGDFLDLSYVQRDKTLEAIHDEKVSGEIWKGMAVDRFWSLITGDAIDAYYAHPWAWDEIGFGGPAYPRAYIRLERGEPEPWEVEEQRYEWLAPAGTVSDKVERSTEPRSESSQHGPTATERGAGESSSEDAPAKEKL